MTSGDPERAVHETASISVSIEIDVEVTVSSAADEAASVIQRLLARGSFEAARDRLNDTARIIANRITGVIPDQTWNIDEDPYGLRVARIGSSCAELPGDIARRPQADPLIFGRTFSAAEFAEAAEIIRQEAAPYGAVEPSSMFNEQARRDFAVSGNGYEFNLGQISVAALTIVGRCHLLQSALDPPADPPLELDS